jgi:hypothetical protein
MCVMLQMAKLQSHYRRSPKIAIFLKVLICRYQVVSVRVPPDWTPIASPAPCCRYWANGAHLSGTSLPASSSA